MIVETHTDAKGVAMRPDTELQADVQDELLWETRVERAGEIAVFAHDGTVTLRGTVGSLGAKRAAGKAAQRVAGVRRVDNELDVRLLTEHRRDDAELRGEALRALSWNIEVPDSVDVTVTDGVVTLKGVVAFRHQRDAAADAVRYLRGVTAIHDEIKVKSPILAADVTDRIESAFERNAHIEADRLRVDAIDGTVTLTGTVTSWAEHDAALDAAWAAPGVTEVKDELEIGY
jgi:osmotically-inducible protein OsmY